MEIEIIHGVLLQNMEISQSASWNKLVVDLFKPGEILSTTETRLLVGWGQTWKFKGILCLLPDVIAM